MLPPGVAGAAEGLRQAVHGLAALDVDGITLGPVLVPPRGDDEQTVCSAVGETPCRGMVAVWQAVVCYGDHGEAATQGLVDDGLFAFGDAGGDEDGAACRCLEATGALLLEAHGIPPVADHSQEGARQQLARAEGVAGDEAVGSRQELSAEFLPGLGRERPATLVPQVAAESGRGERGGDAAAPDMQRGMGAAQQTAARVALDIGTLGGELRSIDGHHIAEAGGEERGPAGGRTAGHTRRGSGGGGGRGGGGGGGTGGSECGGGFGPLRDDFPVAAVAAQLEARKDAAQGLLLAVAADDAALHDGQKMKMVGHDDVVLDGNHRIVGMDGGEQLVLHHAAYGGELDAGCVGAAVRGGGAARHGAQGLAEAVCHMHGDVVDAGAGVVVGCCAAGHAVYGRGALFHCFACGGTARHTCFISLTVSLCSLFRCRGRSVSGRSRRAEWCRC